MIYAVVFLIAMLVLILVLPKGKTKRTHARRKKEFLKFVAETFDGENHQVYVMNEAGLAKSDGLEVEFNFNTDRGKYNDLAMGVESKIIYDKGTFHILDA